MFTGDDYINLFLLCLWDCFFLSYRSFWSKLPICSLVIKKIVSQLCRCFKLMIF